MNIKVFIVVSVALIMSLFANIALGFNVGSKNHENDKQRSMYQELKGKNKKLEKQLKTTRELVPQQELTGNEEAKTTVENFFNIQYQYNSTNYKERFTRIKPYVNQDVYGQLTAAGIPDTPQIKFENKIKTMKLYLTAENKEFSGLVLLDTVYQIDSVESPETQQIFQVTVAKDGGHQKIISLKALGTFAPMSKS